MQKLPQYVTWPCPSSSFLIAFLWAFLHHCCYHCRYRCCYCYSSFSFSSCLSSYLSSSPSSCPSFSSLVALAAVSRLNNANCLVSILTTLGPVQTHSSELFGVPFAKILNQSQRVSHSQTPKPTSFWLVHGSIKGDVMDSQSWPSICTYFIQTSCRSPKTSETQKTQSRQRAASKKRSWPRGGHHFAGCFDGPAGIIGIAILLVRQVAELQATTLESSVMLLIAGNKYRQLLLICWNVFCENILLLA